MLLDTLGNNEGPTRAVAEQHAVTLCLEDAIRSMRDGELNKAFASLESVKIAAGRLDQAHRLFIAPVHFNSYIPPTGNDAAHKALAVPEILEAVMLPLSFSDLLSAQLVDRAMRDAIITSPALRRRMFLESDGVERTKPHVLSLVPLLSSNRHPPITHHVRSPDRHPGELVDWANPQRILTIQVHHNINVVGSRCRTMLITQPPITEMSVQLFCCSGQAGATAEDGYVPVKRAMGITVGDLLHVAEPLIKAHTTCPFAGPERHSRDGIVHVYVMFQGYIPLQGHPPHGVATEGAAAYANLMRVSQNNMVSRQGRMAAFCAAKRAAYEAGEPIPTMQQFEASKSEEPAK